MKKPLTPKRAEMARHILAAKKIATDGDEQVLAYWLECALGEVIGDRNASDAVRLLDEHGGGLQ